MRALCASRARLSLALSVARCASMAAKRRVLVLHGKGGSGPSMKLRFQAIENALPEYDFAYLRRACNPRTGRGGAAAATWIFCGRRVAAATWKLRGRRVAAAPRRLRGYSVGDDDVEIWSARA